MCRSIVLALTLASSASALQAFNVPKLSFGAKTPVAVPANEQPLTERLGGVGVTAPFPEGFDPLNLASRADASEMIKYREAELKHGRIAMLAAPGFLLSENFHPFFPNLPLGEEGIFASQDSWEMAGSQGYLVAALMFAALFEARSFKNWEAPTAFSSAAKAPTPGAIGKSFTMKADAVPGAVLPLGPWTQEALSPEAFARKQNVELNNGRLAMLAIASIVLQELITGVSADLLDSNILNMADRIADGIPL